MRTYTYIYYDTCTRTYIYIYMCVCIILIIYAAYTSQQQQQSRNFCRPLIGLVPKRSTTSGVYIKVFRCICTRAYYSPTDGIIYIKIRRVCTWSQCLISSFASEPGDGRQSAVACPSSSNRLRLRGGQRWRRRRPTTEQRISVTRVVGFACPIVLHQSRCVCVHNIILLCALIEQCSAGRYTGSEKSIVNYTNNTLGLDT